MGTSNVYQENIVSEEQWHFAKEDDDVISRSEMLVYMCRYQHLQYRVNRNDTVDVYYLGEFHLDVNLATLLKLQHTPVKAKKSYLVYPTKYVIISSAVEIEGARGIVYIVPGFKDYPKDQQDILTSLIDTTLAESACPAGHVRSRVNHNELLRNLLIDNNLTTSERDWYAERHVNSVRVLGSAITLWGIAVKDVSIDGHPVRTIPQAVTMRAVLTDKDIVRVKTELHNERLGELHYTDDTLDVIIGTNHIHIDRHTPIDTTNLSILFKESTP